MCIFGRKAVSARWLTSSLLECGPPQGITGTVGVNAKFDDSVTNK